MLYLDHSIAYPKFNNPGNSSLLRSMVLPCELKERSYRSKHMKFVAGEPVGGLELKGKEQKLTEHILDTLIQAEYLIGVNRTKARSPGKCIVISNCISRWKLFLAF